MNRRGFLLGSGAAAAAASLPGRALASIAEAAPTVSSATARMLRAARPLIIMSKMSRIYPVPMLPTHDAPRLTFRRPMAFNHQPTGD